MKKGEIWWAELEPPAGRRPVALLSRDDAYQVRSLVIVASVTTRIRNIPSEVLLSTEDELPRACAINLDVITTIPKECLSQKITLLKPEKQREVDNAIRFALGMLE
jgi:mRNA interferase MazF